VRQNEKKRHEGEKEEINSNFIEQASQRRGHEIGEAVSFRNVVKTVDNVCIPSVVLHHSHTLFHNVFTAITI
jgi:hypothetical protein